jgi:glycosyltransferase involved in cell wall biosynthesis
LNVLILNNMTPFVRGGAEELASHLCARLNSTPGVQAEVLRVPFSWEPFERLADEIFLNRTLQLSNADRVIGLKFPAYLIPHHSKVLWVLHQYRQAYDLRDRGESNIPATPAGEKICELVRRADAEVFASCRSLFTLSKTTQDRLKRYNGVAASVLMQPLNHPELFSDGGDSGYIFAGGRVNAGKRQHLLVEAMAVTRSGAKLIVAGPPDTPDDANRLQEIVRRFKLEDRVTLDLGYHPLAKVADYVNHARACASLPLDEDSVAYVTMEAASASKPLIALTDSGGVLQLVLDRETGRVASPDPKSIAEAIDLLFSDPGRSARMGRAARELLDSFEVTWPKTIEKLLA